MTWLIHSWDTGRKTGTVASPHFGPWPFGPVQNDYDIDFLVGEDVIVDLAGPPESYDVIRVRPRRPEVQPENTEYAPFEALNCAGDLREEEDSTPERIHLWVGNCCGRCGPWARVVFEGSTGLIGYDEDRGIENPHFRFASEIEVQEMSLPIGEGRRAYCIVDRIKAVDRPRPRVFVVATDVCITSFPCGL